ncbi:hypothetical protein SEA_HITTER_33 [Gordonia phage Hitter]|nr:hypothetical protein SEA_HITTER_33 [Gordonia phage Hitter]
MQAHCPECQKPMTVVYTNEYRLHERDPHNLDRYECRTMDCENKRNPSGYRQDHPNAAPDIRDPAL